MSSIYDLLKVGERVNLESLKNLLTIMKESEVRVFKFGDLEVQFETKLPEFDPVSLLEGAETDVEGKKTQHSETQDKEDLLDWSV